MSPAMLQDFADLELINPDLILVDCPPGEHEPDHQVLQHLATEASPAEALQQAAQEQRETTAEMRKSARELLRAASNAWLS